MIRGRAKTWYIKKNFEIRNFQSKIFEKGFRAVDQLAIVTNNLAKSRLICKISFLSCPA